MSTCIKRRTFINLVIDTYVERVLQTAFNLSRYLRYLDYFLLKYLKYMLFGVVFLTYQKGDKRVCFNSKYLRVSLPLYKK